MLFQLGEHLISDATQALLELIKNSYDADATTVLVEVDSDWMGLDSKRRPRLGRITITDNGDGMSRETIEQGWLTISGSPKRALKRAGWRSRLDRTPLGDKGLGRLGVQRLGANVLLETAPKGGNQRFRVTYSWDDFRNAQSLETVDVLISEETYSGSSGTTIVIEGLTEAEEWRDKATIDRLEESLSQLVSPYEIVSDFAVDVVVDDVPLTLSRVGQDVLNAAHVHYDLSFQGSSLLVSGRIKRAFLRPPAGDKLADFNRLIEMDGGQAFFDWIMTNGQSRSFDLRRSDDPRWFLAFSATVPLAGKWVRRSPVDPSAPANPGPFRGRVDAFDFGRTASAEQSVFSAGDDFKRYVQRFTGIRVYRDGFGIRTDRDWLGLSAAATSGKSYYSLRPKNTMGFIAISASENPNLREKTDREGFQVTPHYDNFVGLLHEFVSFTDLAQSRLRRDYNAFVGHSVAQEAGVKPNATPTELTEQLREQLAAGESLRAPVQDLAARLQHQAANVADAIARAETTASEESGLQVTRVLAPLRKHVASLHKELQEAQSTWTSVDSYLAATARLDPVGAILQEQIADIEGQVSALYETASLGITSEALSHELANVVERLRTRARAAATHLKTGTFTVVRAREFVSSVQDAVAAVRKQLAHLAPSLKYVREERQIISVLNFLTELAEYHNERWKGAITMKVAASPGGEFDVFMNPGKLTQVFDNLLLNSEFWINSGHRSRVGVITVDVDQPFVRVSDNGPGVAKTLELSLFQPFVSGKPKGSGRGLGLFIIDRLLAADGCTIGLSEHRNAEGKLDTFELNFAEAAHEGV